MACAERNVAAVLALFAIACSTPPHDACEGLRCSSRGRCVTFAESPYCACERGAHAEGLACVENDPSDPCRGVDCSGHGECAVVDGAPRCACEPGFVLEGGGTLCVPAPRVDGGPSCAGMVCDEPPESYCLDGATLRTYAAIGACSDGTCTHASIDTECPGGCAVVACVRECTPVAWTAELVDSEGNAGLDPSIAVDDEGRVHVVYWEYVGREIRYARRGSGGSWSTTVIGTGDDPTLVLDGSGSVHVSFYDLSDLRYASLAPGGSWTGTTVEAEGDTGLDPSIAVDPSGAIHIGYGDYTNDALRYAYRVGAEEWTSTTLDSTIGYDPDASIAVDEAGAVHLAYRGPIGELRYARHSPGGTWSTEMIARAGSFISLAVDRDGGVHIAYHDGDALVYAFRGRDSGAIWTTTVVDTEELFGGWFASLGLDPYGGVHVSYVHNGGDLRYAYRVPSGDWEIAGLVDDTILGAALAVDATGGVHVAYKSDDDLYYGYQRVCP